MIKRVTTIGTCRVFEPILLLSNQSLLTMNNSMVYGYTHTTKELIQMLYTHNDSFNCDISQLKFILKNIDHYEVAKNKNLEESDVVVIEISSIRVITNDHVHYYKANLIHNYILESLDNAELYWKDLTHNRVKKLTEYGVKKDLSDVDVDFINGIECINQNRNDFISDLEKILSLIPKDRKVIFVSHFDMKIDNIEQRVPERVLVAKWLEEFCDIYGCVFYNPRFDLEKYGYAKGLLDNTHYTKEYERILSNKYLGLINE